MLIFLHIIGYLMVGLGLLVLFHSYLNGHFRQQQCYHLVGVSAIAPHFAETLASMSDSLITQGASTQFWSEIDAIQENRLALMQTAKQLIQFETFIMTPGGRANAFAEVALQKASEGVTIQLLVDSYGTKSLPQSYWQRLRNAGIEVRFFNPFSVRSPLDYLRRNHRKLLIVDQQAAMVGGAGIADLWDGKDQYDSEIPWYDFEVKWQGNVVGLLTGFFWQHWLSAGGEVRLADHHPGNSKTNQPGPILITPAEDPSRQDAPIRSLYQICMTAAQQRLWIASPYLLPDAATRSMLGTVKQRGVDVRILTMGPKSDKPPVYYVSRENYRSLLKQGIQIYEYQPSMMHAKIVLIDDQWVSLGSANLDPRSYFHNDELNLCCQTPEFIRQVDAFFETGFSRSQLIRFEDWQTRSPKQKLIGQLGSFFYGQL